MEQMEVKVQKKHFIRISLKTPFLRSLTINGATFVPVSETGFVKARNLSLLSKWRLGKAEQNIFVSAKV